MTDLSLADLERICGAPVAVPSTPFLRAAYASWVGTRIEAAGLGNDCWLLTGALPDEIWIAGQELAELYSRGHTLEDIKARAKEERDAFVTS